MATEVAVIGLDPGRNLGVAFLSAAGEVLFTDVLHGGGVGLHNALRTGAFAFPAAPIVVVDGTGHQEITAVLAQHGYTYTLMNEKNSSREARELYYQLFPPRGWLRLVPRGMLPVPPGLDAFAAVIIAQRYLQTVRD